MGAEETLLDIYCLISMGLSVAFICRMGENIVVTLSNVRTLHAWQSIRCRANMVWNETRTNGLKIRGYGEQCDVITPCENPTSAVSLLTHPYPKLRYNEIPQKPLICSMRREVWLATRFNRLGWKLFQTRSELSITVLAWLKFKAWFSVSASD